tara:strand:- start:1222 stop:1386 length:165 start_codon:yes stop_codon:yes gene_type:complete
MKSKQNDDELNKDKNPNKKKMGSKKDPSDLRKSHLFMVVLEFYVRQIELSFSFN